MPYNRPGAAPRKPHAADVYHAEQVARAVRYTIHFRSGPLNTIKEAVDTMEEARTIAARLNAAHGQFGRRAMIYGVTPEGASFPIS